MGKLKQIRTSALSNRLNSGKEIFIPVIIPVQEITEWYIPNNNGFTVYDKLKVKDANALHSLFPNLKNIGNCSFHHSSISKTGQTIVLQT